MSSYENFSASDSSTNNEGLKLSELIDTLLQHIWLIASVFGAVVVLAALYAFFATPVYRADALIQVEDKKSSALSGVQEIADALGAGASPVSGEIEILKSREVVMTAIEATQADIKVEVANRFPFFGDWYARRVNSGGTQDTPLGLSSYAWGGESLKFSKFDVSQDGFGKQYLIRVVEEGFEVEGPDEQVIGSGRVGELFSSKTENGSVSFIIEKLSGRPGTEFLVSRVAAVAAYREILGGLTVAESARQSGIIEVAFEHSDPNFGKNLVNAVARAYLDQNVARRTAEADQSLTFLNQQLPEIKRSVEEAEEALNAFKTRTNIVSVDKATDALLGQAIATEKQRMELQIKRNALAQQFTSEHPEVKALNSQLATMAQESRALESQVNLLPAAQRDLLRLQRDAEVSNQLYIALLNNAQQLKVAKAGTIGNVRVIDYAVIDDRPVAPKKILVVVGGAFLGLFLGIFAALISRMLRPSIREATEVERVFNLPSYANIPESAFQEKLDSSKRDGKARSIIDGRLQLLALIRPDDAAIESLRSLRTGLSFALMDAENKNIVITGATAALGKSFVSANLSALLASAGKKILVIETDMRRPQLGAYFGYTKASGLSDILIGECSLVDAVKNVPLPEGTLHVLPSGQVPPNPGELLLGARFKELLDSVQDSYDYIILDSAPLLPVGDTLAVVRCAATVLLVVRSEQSTIAEVRDAIKKLETAGAYPKGFIFNGIKQRRVGYGYRYKYYYGYGD